MVFEALKGTEGWYAVAEVGRHGPPLGAQVQCLVGEVEDNIGCLRIELHVPRRLWNKTSDAVLLDHGTIDIHMATRGMDLH